ncbi:putative bifunctional diguanylate cyclase/phosphodiesterase [Jiella sp. M17.18]|uniref:putative bifunctional diguanylate cyclase/phosphodiesterase n=1 Tax=Jiella sp. M17.18 TaxID=3234247 RepID=UPI0034DEE09E
MARARILEDRWELPLLTATAGLGFVAAWLLFASVNYMTSISRSAENNVVYEVMTTSPELGRLQATIAGRFIPGTGITDDDVALRFAIIENRMKVLGTQSSRHLRRDGEEATALLAKMQAVVRSVAPRVEHLATPADAAAVLNALEPLNTQATRLAALTTSTAATRIAENESELIRVFWLLLADILGLLSCGITLVALLRRARQKARHRAATDDLTQLPNRLSFNRRLAEVHAAAGPGALSVLMFDIDLFKQVNDTMGHAAGDTLLRLVAERLAPVLQEADVFARLSGDEFAALFASPAAEKDARDAAERIVAALAAPFDILDSHLPVSVSIGIAVARPDDVDPEDILGNADLALYAVKESGRGSVRLYEPGLREASQERQTLSEDLEAALAEDRLELHFQPLVSLADRRTVGFEALLRWRHDAFGWVPPDRFIPIAEETALILPMGRWVIAKACMVAAQWPDDIEVAVNLSARQFNDPQLVTTIVQALSTHGLKPERLTLEITETALIQNDRSVLDTLNALRAIGVRTALDDFGTGYASLSYLTRFPFDIIKIDQTFVRGAPRHHDSSTIVQAICYLAAELGLATIAEGIETEDHLAVVRGAGCDYGQGYFFDRPMPAADCATRLSLERLRGVAEHKAPAGTEPGEDCGRQEMAGDGFVRKA